MKLKFIVAAFAVSLVAVAQPALANWTYDKNGEPTHYKGIPVDPIPTVEQARAATEKRIAAIKAEEAKQAEEAANSGNQQSEISNQQLFFTGKPYIEETGQYLFLFRYYDPKLSRWTTADPSGFPDGVNNFIYCLAPTFELDIQGLYVQAVYNIHERKLTLTDERGTVTFSNLNSGNNSPCDIGKQSLGPLPTGTYRIATRLQGQENYPGTNYPGFILDPVDSIGFNGKWDTGPGKDRGDFRIHPGGASGTVGCIVAQSNYTDLYQFLSSTTPAGGIWDFGSSDGYTFTGEFILGSLVVISGSGTPCE